MAEISERLRKKMEKTQKKIKESGGNNKGMLYIKANETIRVRILPVGEDNEPGLEIIQFYLGGELKGQISPKSLGEPCALMEKYEELKKKGNEDDAGLMEKLKPKRKYVIPVVKKKSKTDRDIDEKVGIKLLQIPSGVYQSLIDMFMDAELGDFTHPLEGYDVKITRTGSTMTDTEYSVLPCKASPLPKEYRKPVDVEQLLRKAIPSYDETVSMLHQIMPSSGKKKLKKKIKSRE